MKLNQTFRHHKGGIYTLLHIAQSESDGSKPYIAVQMARFGCARCVNF